MNDVLLQYGLAGVVIFGLATYILLMDKRYREERAVMRKDHAEERERWMKAFEKMFEGAEKIQDKTNESLTEVGNILIGLKTLFEVHVSGKINSK